MNKKLLWFIAPLLAIAGTLVALFVFSVGYILYRGSQSAPYKSHVAVVTTEGVQPLDERLKARLDIAAEMLRNGQVKRVLVSGDITPKNQHLATVMGQYLMKQGVIREALLLDLEGFDIYHSTHNAAKIIKSEDLKPVILIGERESLYRQRFIWEKCAYHGVQTQPIAFKWENLGLLPKEVMATVQAIIQPCQPN